MALTFERQSLEKISGDSFIDGNRVELLYKGRETFSAIFRSIEDATSFICLHFYIFRNDETGERMAELLKSKAREGVKVYVIYDHFGSLETPWLFWDDMEDAGVRIRASRPFNWLSPHHYVRRDHRKLIICDGVKAYTGGLNIADEYGGFLRRLKRPVWRDTGVLLEGPVAFSLFEIFQKTWQALKGDPIPSPTRPVFPPSSDQSDFCLPVIPIFASSSRGRRRMRKLIYYSIRTSTKSISLTTAYFTPSRRMLDSLEDAVKRGVEVKLLLPGISDVMAPYYAGRSSFMRLLMSGVKIFNYQGEVLHAKTFVFDGCWSIVGSANLDFQSLRWNDEGNVGLLNEGFGRKMMEVFEEDMSHSIEIKEDLWRKRPVTEKIKEKFFILFRRRL